MHLTSKGRILLVEDDADTRFVFAKLLEIEGYQVETASSGQEALDKLASGPRPLVVLLDLTMPGMNGLDFRSAQSKLESLAQVPVIVTSGRDDIAQRAQEMKVQGHLRKPFSIEELLQALRPLSVNSP